MVAALGLLSGCSGGDAQGAGGAGDGGRGGDGGARSPGDSVDRSDLSFVGNLRAKVADGEWTQGEGLVATLQVFAGELDAASVLRHPEILNAEGTGILALAYEYLEDGPDAEAKAEIARLLDLVVFSNEQLEEMAGIGATPKALPGQLTPSVRKAAEENCKDFFAGFRIPAGVGQCLQVRTSPVLDQLYPGAYRVFGPADSLPKAGWTTHHYDLIIEALERSIPILKALGDVKLTNVNIVLSVKGDPKAAAVAAPKTIDFPDRPCGIALHLGMQQESDGNFKQFLAHELAHCLHGETFTQQTDHDSSDWWDEGLSEYWSNVVYPGNNAEWQWLVPLARMELTTTLFDRAYPNALFFQYLSSRVGNQGIINIIYSLGDADDRATLEAKLAAYARMDEIFHDFAKAKTDEQIMDTSGERIPYKISEVNRPTVSLTGPRTIKKDFKPFGVSRHRLGVQEGKLASLAYGSEGFVRESARPSEGMSWSEIPLELPDNLCEPEVILVVTATGSNAGFELEVTKVEDTEAECGIVGTWVVDNSSIRFDPGDFTVSAPSGQISITFDDDGIAELVYSGFSYTFSKDTVLPDVGGILVVRHEENTYTTFASGMTTYEVDGSEIIFGHFFERSYLVGREEVHIVRTHSPSIGEDLDEVSQNDPDGIGLFGTSAKFDLRPGGSVMRILGPGDQVEAVLTRQ